MSTKRSIIMDEVLRDAKGDIIGLKECVNEIHHKSNETECITREIITDATGRIVIDKLLYKSIIKNNCPPSDTVLPKGGA